MEEQAMQGNQALSERLEVIKDQLIEYEKQYSKLLDLYLVGDFSREILTERKARLEETIAGLKAEQIRITAHIQSIGLTDDQIENIEAFCDEIREGLEVLNFDTKRRIINFLDVRGTLAVENNEKVVYARCRISQQQLSLVQTLP